VNTNGTADCEPGQRGYAQKLNHLDPRGRNLVTDNHTPGSQGPTWTGLARVPPGQTWTRNTSTGPQTPFIAANP
jgi:hypothetical protein